MKAKHLRAHRALSARLPLVIEALLELEQNSTSARALDLHAQHRCWPAQTLCNRMEDWLLQLTMCHVSADSFSMFVRYPVSSSMPRYLACRLGHILLQSGKAQKPFRLGPHMPETKERAKQSALFWRPTEKATVAPMAMR